MDYSRIGVISALACLSLGAGSMIDGLESMHSTGGRNASRKPRPKPSGQPIPEGTMTRQQRRANERAAFKRLPA